MLTTQMCMNLSNLWHNSYTQRKVHIMIAERFCPYVFECEGCDRETPMTYATSSVVAWKSVLMDSKWKEINGEIYCPDCPGPSEVE